MSVVGNGLLASAAICVAVGIIEALERGIFLNSLLIRVSEGRPRLQMRSSVRPSIKEEIKYT